MALRALPPAYCRSPRNQGRVPSSFLVRCQKGERNNGVESLSAFPVQAIDHHTLEVAGLAKQNSCTFVSRHSKAQSRTGFRRQLCFSSLDVTAGLALSELQVLDLPPVLWPSTISFPPIHFIQLQQPSSARSSSTGEQQGCAAQTGDDLPAFTQSSFDSNTRSAAIAANTIQSSTLSLAPPRTLMATLAVNPASLGSTDCTTASVPQSTLTTSNLELLQQNYETPRKSIRSRIDPLKCMAGGIWDRFWASMPKQPAAALVLASLNTPGEAGTEAAGGNGGMDGGADDAGGAGGANRSVNASPQNASPKMALQTCMS